MPGQSDVDEQAIDSASCVRNLTILQLNTEYRTAKESPAQLFYNQCLSHASQYKRAAGYFRSSVFGVIGSSLVEFARSGGTMQLICSPELSTDDIDTISAGYAKKNEIIVQRLIEQIDSLLSTENTAYPTRVLATLVAVGSLDIKIALRADRKGIYHEKI